jgi:GH15 family glucan-1,4-alpha-glucosidase
VRHRSTSPGPTRSAFPPIADYGFLSDCETTALIAPDGNVEWLCLPRMDSPSVFGAVLDRDAGSFRLGPTGVKVPAGRRYLPGTMVLETSWGTRGGWLIVRDVLLMGPWHHTADRSGTHRRTPTDYDADHVLLRMVRCVNGEVQLGLSCEPAFDYGAQRATWEYSGDAYHQAVARSEGSDLELRLSTDLNLGIEGPRVTSSRRAKRCSAPSPGASTRPRRATTRPTTGSCGPRTTGSTGSTGGTSPTIRGAPTCSAAPSPSRA